MNFEFTGRHMDVTPALKAHVEDQFARIENVFDGKPATAHVVIEVERGRHNAEVVINWRNETLTAVSSHDDMYQSLSQSIAKIEKQARKLKDKVIDKSHRATKTGVAAAMPEEIELAVTEEVESGPPEIIEVNSSDAKPMTPDEAALDLDEGGKQFVIFNNSESGKVAVMFKRSDGNYGLVTP